MQGDMHFTDRTVTCQVRHSRVSCHTHAWAAEYVEALVYNYTPLQAKRHAAHRHSNILHSVPTTVLRSQALATAATARFRACATS